MSVSSSGAQGDGVSGDCALNDAGDVVFFNSRASTLDVAKTGASAGVFVHRISDGHTEYVSYRWDGAQDSNTPYDISTDATGTLIFIDGYSVLTPDATGAYFEGYFRRW